MKMSIYKEYHANQKINLIGKYKVLAFALAALLLASCSKDDSHNPPHPDKGAVVITTDWASALSAADIPTTYYVDIDGKAVQTNQATACYPYLQEPGSHDLLVYNTPKGMEQNGEIATVNPLPDGTLEPMPEYLFSATAQLQVVKDDTLRVTVPMNRLLCPIELNLSMNGGSIDKIEQITATLSGITPSVNMRSGERGGESSVASLRVQTGQNRSAARTETSVQLKCRMPGVSTTERQILTVTLTMQGGQQSILTSDLTEQLKNLNTDMKPIELDAAIEIPQEGIFTGSIKDWTEVKGDDIEAN